MVDVEKNIYINPQVFNNRMFRPKQGKAGVFDSYAKNQKNKELQKELANKRDKSGGANLGEGRKSKYDAWTSFRPKTRQTKRGFFTDKNFEMQRRQTRAQNLDVWEADIKAQYGGAATITRQGSNVDVMTGFQKFKYMDDPMGFGEIQLKEVEAFVPEGFTKVKTDTGFIIKAAPKKYQTRYKRRKGSSSSKDYGSYVPVQAFLDAEGNLQKVVKQDDYLTYAKYSDSGKEKRYGVMTTEETVFENNRKKMSKFWDDYKKEEKESSSGKERSYYDKYLKKEVNYGTGETVQYNRPGTEYQYSQVKQKPQTTLKTTTVLGKTYEHSKNTGVYNIGGKVSFVKIQAPGANDPYTIRQVK